MEQHLIGIAKYIKDKLVKGEFEFIEAGSCTCKVSIDNYTFCIWIGNEMPQYLYLFDYGVSFIGDSQTKEIFRFSDQEKESIFSVLRPKIEGYINSNLIEKKEKELQEIKNSIDWGR